MIADYKKEFLKSSEVYLRLKIRPGADKTQFQGEMADSSLKLDIKARPERNLANKELISFLAKEFGVGLKNIKIISGAADRLKLVRIKS
jgi:hypothetical protein